MTCDVPAREEGAAQSKLQYMGGGGGEGGGEDKQLNKEEDGGGGGVVAPRVLHASSCNCAPYCIISRGRDRVAAAEATAGGQEKALQGTQGAEVR